MERAAYITAAVLLCGFLLINVKAQDQNPEAKRSELKSIQQKVEQRTKELERYKKQQQSINRHIQNLESEKKKAEKRKKLIEQQIRSARTSAQKAQQQKDAFLNASDNWMSLYAAEMAIYAADVKTDFRYYGLNRLKEHIYLVTILEQKTQLLDSLAGEQQQIEQTAQRWTVESKKLEGTGAQLAAAQKKRDADYRTKKRELTQTQRQYEKVLTELKGLQSTAKSLMDFLETFEKQQPSKPKPAASRQLPATELTIPANSLPWPVSGRVSSKFGREYLAELKVWVKREGVRITTAHEAPVRSVAAGTVIYAGEFKSFGNVVIIDHKTGYYTIYGFLSSISVDKGTDVKEGTTIAAAGIDSQTSVLNQTSGNQSELYFEIRAGAKALDPLKWLKKQ